MSENKVLALGIDQGLANMGYCVIAVDTEQSSCPEVLDSGVFETNNTITTQYRIKHLYDELDKIIEKYPAIKVIGTESLFVNNFKAGGRNKSAAIVPTNMVTGAIMLLGANNYIPVQQYTPGTVKKYITGSGDASKESVEEALGAVIEKNGVVIRADHQSDAIAIAWTAAMDIIKNGTPSVIKNLADKPKRKKKPRIVNTKSFMMLSGELEEDPQKPMGVIQHIKKMDSDSMSQMLEQSISGRFNKGLIVIKHQHNAQLALRYGFEVGKRAANAVSVLPGTWFCVELFDVEEKNINRARTNLLRQLSKNKEYQQKKDGRVMDVFTEWGKQKFSVQLFIEVEPRLLEE